MIWTFLVFSWVLWPCRTNSELTVNVSRNKTHPNIGVVKEIITGNASTDTVSIEFNEADGTLITYLTDFRTNSQILRLIIPGEEELNEPRAQIVCFVSSFNNDLISPEAVSKLRQKHPHAIRVADEDMGEIVQDSPLRIAKNQLISTHLGKSCKEAYTSHYELDKIFNGNLHKVKEYLHEETDIKYQELSRCFSLAHNDAYPCICSRQVYLNWYPCSIRYCKNNDDEGEHRCGVKTCLKVLTFRYKVKSKLYCNWDEP